MKSIDHALEALRQSRANLKTDVTETLVLEILDTHVEHQHDDDLSEATKAVRKLIFEYVDSNHGEAEQTGS